MKKIENQEEMLCYLKQKQRLYIAKDDFFIMKDDNIYEFNKGSRFILSYEDFIALYEQKDFYYLEDDNSFIDNDKDEAYYHYYKK